MIWVYCDVFVFKQKTAYEMRISDWSSDVCSSDLLWRNRRPSDAGMGTDVHRPCRTACYFASHALNGIVAPVIARASAEENYIRAEASSAGRSSETCPMNILTVRSSKWM